MSPRAPIINVALILLGYLLHRLADLVFAGAIVLGAYVVSELFFNQVVPLLKLAP